MLRSIRLGRNMGIKMVQWLLSAIGVLISIGGSLAVWEVQSARQGVPLWPLPALILIDWVLLGLFSFLGTYLGTERESVRWLGVSWFTIGALVPLVVLGAFSIGGIVLLSLLAFFVAALLTTLLQEIHLFPRLGLLILGVVANLLVLYLIIVFSQPYL